MSLTDVALNRRSLDLAYSGEAEQHVSPLRVFSILRRRKLLVAAVMLAVGVPATLVIAGLPPYYDAEATVMIHTGKSEFSDLQASAAGTSGDAIMIRTQTDIIRSPAMARRVVDKLDLVHAPEFERLLHARASLLRRGLAWLNALLDKAGPDAAAATSTDQRQAAAAILQTRVSVTNDGHSYLIGIRARTGDPVLSAAIAGAYTQLYFDFNRDLKTAAIERGRALLDAQIAPLKARLQATENAVEAYRDRNNLVVNRVGEQGGRGSTVADQQLSQASAELIVATASLAQKEASLRAVQGATRGGGVGSVPEVVASPLIQRLREQETELSGRQASLGETVLGNNPAMQSVQAGLADTRRRIGAEVAKIVSSLSNEVAAARTRVATLQDSVAQLQAQVSGQSQATVSLRALESEADAARTVYKDYLGRYEQTSSQAALQEPEADLVSAAEVPATRSGPPRLQLVAIAGIASLLLGSLCALGVERMRGGLRTSEELEAQTGLFPLGFVPSGSRRERLEVGRFSAYSASVDMVRSLLDHGASTVSARVVAITSALPREGRTGLALSLAMSAGRKGGRSLLVDCDVARPALVPLLGLSRRTAGATDDGAGARLQWHRDARPSVDLVSIAEAGAYWSAALVAELGRLIEAARDEYGLIVLDLPPVLAGADAAALASLADGTVVVVRWASTPARAINAAARLLQAYNLRILGGVMTQVRVKELAGGEGAQSVLYRSHAGYFG